LRSICRPPGHRPSRPTPLFSAALLALLAGGPGLAGAEPGAGYTAAHEAAGLRASLRIRPVSGPVVKPGEPALFTLEFAGAEDGSPVRGLRPAAWAERLGRQASAQSCRERTASLLQRAAGRRPEVDLNAWQLAIAGDTGVVAVVDPQGGTTRTRLLSLVNPGGAIGAFVEDAERDAILVSVPERGEVVEIDTRRWVERRRIAVGGRPGPLQLEPGGARLWVGQDGRPGALAEVAVLDRASGAVAARLVAPAGAQALAVLGPDRALVAAPGGAFLLDATASAAPLRDIPGGFADVAWSALAELALLLDASAGQVIALGRDGTPRAAWSVAPGAAGLFLDPAGRLLFVPEPGEGRLTVIDLARGAVAHRVALEGRPLRVGFSRTQAYVQGEAGATVSLIALRSLVEGGMPAIAGIAAGERGLRPGEAVGPTIVSAPGQEAMLIAASEERAVHVYMEGMAAPTGVLRAPYGRPLALAAVDRSLREVAPGRHETTAVFPGPGRYVLPVMLQGASFLHCFEMEVEGEERLPLARRLSLEFAGDDRRLPANSPSTLRLRLRGPEGEAAWRAAPDLRARVVQFDGGWQLQLPLRPLGDGLYEFVLTPPKPGPVHMFVESRSLGLAPESLPQILLRAEARR
jgi:hypothetical protein